MLHPAILHTGARPDCPEVRVGRAEDTHVHIDSTPHDTTPTPSASSAPATCCTPPTTTRKNVEKMAVGNS